MDPRFSIILGILGGALFSMIFGAWQRGLKTGLICGICTAVIMAMLLLPIWLAMEGILFRLT